MALYRKMMVLFFSILGLIAHDNLQALQRIPLQFFITPTDYGETLSTDVLFEQQIPENTLKEVLSNAEKTIFTIAETEKYAHVIPF